MKAHVHVGKEGLSPSVLATIDREVGDRELIKVRLLESLEGDRKAVAREIAERTGTELVQVLGRTLLLWRRNPEEPTITLPD
jgi:RNA-binding protein